MADNLWSAEDLRIMCERVRELAGCRPDCQIRAVERDSEASIYCDEHNIQVDIPRAPVE